MPARSFRKRAASTFTSIETGSVSPPTPTSQPAGASWSRDVDGTMDKGDTPPLSADTVETVPIVRIGDPHQAVTTRCLEDGSLDRVDRVLIPAEFVVQIVGDVLIAGRTGALEFRQQLSLERLHIAQIGFHGTDDGAQGRAMLVDRTEVELHDVNGLSKISVDA